MARPDVRELLLDAGLGLLRELGFNGSGVKEITDRAGVPKGSFYNYFDSKEALGAEVVKRYAETNARPTFLRDGSLPPLERLRRHFAALTETYNDLAFQRGCLLGNLTAEIADHSPLIRQELSGLFTAWTEDIAAAVRDAQSEGTVSAERDAGELAAFLLDAYEGALLRARAEKSRAPLDRFMAIMLTRILAR